ncbi:MAG: hypothetical protein U0794_07615 [Isosphaeraceae bacterium]
MLLTSQPELLEPRLLLAAEVTSILSYRPGAGGVYDGETTLAPANVNATTFGKRLSIPVDGQVYAQPLFVPGLAITTGEAPGIHDTVIVATENDSVYAIDADSGAILWETSFVDPSRGITAVPSDVVQCWDVSPRYGITGTPVIDPATNTLYVVANTLDTSSGTNVVAYTLHALDLSTGAEKPGGPVTIAETGWNFETFDLISGPQVAGTGDGSVDGVITFNAVRQHQRSALALSNGIVYVAFGAHCVGDPYHGWILGYDAQTLAPRAVFNTTPNAQRGGIWMNGNPPKFDEQGNLYVMTGNGTFDATLDAAGFPSLGNYGDSFLKLAVDPASTPASPNINGWGLKVLDYFTPSNQAVLDEFDKDLGSGSVLLLPDGLGSAEHPHLLVGGGKDGTIFLLDRDDMGKFGVQVNRVVQELPGTLTAIFDAPALLGSTLYYVPGYADTAKSYTIADGRIGPTPTSASAETFGFPGPTPVISADAGANGIVWLVDRSRSQLRAYDAQGFDRLLYTSAQAANERDVLGTASKFSVPVVAEGRVLVGTASSLVIYGLLDETPPPPPALERPNAPTGLAAASTPDGTVTLAWTAPLRDVSGFEVAESTDGITFTDVASLAPDHVQLVLTGRTPGIAYRYVVRAWNAAGVSDPSNIVAVTIPPIEPPPPPPPPSGGEGLDFGTGFVGAADGLVLNGAIAVDAAGALVLTDGRTYEASSVFSATTLPIGAFSTSFRLRFDDVAADGMTFTIQGVRPTSVGQTGASLGYGGDSGGPGIDRSVAVKFDLYDNYGEGTDSTGLVTNGALPAGPAVDLAGSGIDFHAEHDLDVTIEYDGTNLVVTITDLATAARAVQSYEVDLPTVVGGPRAYVGFTAATGGYAATQRVLSWTYTSGTSVPDVPASPSGLRVVAISGQDARLTWVDTASSTTAYRIERRDADAAGFASLAVLPAGEATFVDSGLTPGATYIYRVIALANAGESLPSGEVSLTLPTRPAVPTNPIAVVTGDGRIRVSWSDQATDESGYKIFRREGEQPESLVAVLSENATIYDDGAVVPGGVYNYRIVAFNAAGESESATVAITVPIPSDPTDPAPSGLDLGQGFGSADGLLVLNGSARVEGRDLVLTDGTVYSASSAFTASTVAIDRFTTRFRLEFKGAEADGMTFTIQGVGATAVGQTGGSLGYGLDHAGAGIARSAAVKFDLYDNYGEGDSSTGLFTEGVYPSVPAVDLTGSAIDFRGGHPFDVVMSYDGIALDVSITDVVTGASVNQRYVVDLVSLVGGTQGYVGFTASTGGYAADQRVTSWVYTPGLPVAG